MSSAMSFADTEIIFSIIQTTMPWGRRAAKCWPVWSRTAFSDNLAFSSLDGFVSERAILYVHETGSAAAPSAVWGGFLSLLTLLPRLWELPPLSAAAACDVDCLGKMYRALLAPTAPPDYGICTKDKTELYCPSFSISKYPSRALSKKVLHFITGHYLPT